MDIVPIRTALLSVSDKTGLVEFATALANAGVRLLSTGGTARTLREAGLAVTDVAEVTGHPEILDGRVKTLHPKIHGGLLGLREDDEHRRQMAAHGIQPIDLLVVNLYPFEATVASGAGYAECIENIDIGGPAMVRAAAKNHEAVAVVTDPAQYERVAGELAVHRGTSLATRRQLALQAYASTGAYDAAISAWLAGQIEAETFLPSLPLGGRLKQTLRYGENPHQKAAFYVSDLRVPGVGSAEQVQGKELGYNNIADTDAALACVAEFGEPACVIVKHANPCGAALGTDPLDAYRKALASDPTSAFGGIVAFNRPIDAATAEAVTGIFTEVVIAPGADEAAREIFARKKNLRLLLTAGLPAPDRPRRSFRSVDGGFLIQEEDISPIAAARLTSVTARAPGEQERADLLFAFAIAKHVKSNAIVLARNGATVGIGGGQTSRVDAARIAVERAKAGGGAEGTVVASDAFFPFPDALMIAVEAGATAAIHPGGSVKDQEVVAAADQAGIAMVTTGVRHFRH
ncbi:MAG TPA: bifunctional phosphoribosylaminoimidazolecarboxamide formyltransferase/IMP cyclohydrolase [Geminicoccus sp.]|jgi:phosphoribosylaminoimidazolecarboxamide formyltransferase/IMP cyclohydrolase|uniref:bifunctional phosphoribosylaminoimidazolecarboxamide formyltransferase/IMP cyclohydrolase n=1 Tax=Geminicoccus sp. TaxID=2024832 RepID=UPI002E368FF2|nr:bifunctional phosphoribosylaminoimidazolecarboxamide formyltransferase/IMP cyclohydrolase [Geminicoccus sp.]HEX2527306.1 bifunctional phosphoribosylaminoimidazolecarboxamide formyltransferase/IMP cyclohydrolase [Geminicoccus sp.]